VGKALRELQDTLPKEWLWLLDEIHAFLDVLPPDGSQTLYALWKQPPGRRSKPNQARSPMEQLRDLLLRLSQAWQNYCTFLSEPLVPWTNNGSERAIGKMKPVLSLSKGCEPAPSGGTNLGRVCIPARSGLPPLWCSLFLAIRIPLSFPFSFFRPPPM
jgi:hypothetical protein